MQLQQQKCYNKIYDNIRFGKMNVKELIIVIWISCRKFSYYFCIDKSKLQNIKSQQITDIQL